MALRWLVHSACHAIGYPNESGSAFISRQNDVVKAPITVPSVLSGKGSVTDGYFQMPVHYPRYQKADYEKMEEWKIDMLLREYGFVSVHFNTASLDDKRAFAIGAFLWPDQL